MSRFKTIVMIFVLLLISAGILTGVRQVQRSLDDQVAQHHLRFTGEIRNAPPMVIFTTVALGSFRGLVADLLWLRAESLKEKQSYYEMVQLAQWITDLQPTFSGATAYLAWNMAYNISVTCSGFDERWRWVNEGIRLIRDKALDYNPEDPVLYKEIAWIFQHKLGNIMDDANLYYKNQLAMQMMNITGSGNPDWERLAAAPESMKEFEKKYAPEQPVWSALKAAGFADMEALYNAFRSTEPAALPAAFVQKLDGDKVFVDSLTDFLRAELLRRKLKLEPKRIVALNKKYGEMDWRVPEAQAIYWATLGIERTPGHRDLNCDRLITQSLYESFRAGRLLMIDDRNFESIQVVPNLALVDSVFETFTATQERYDGKDSYFSTFRSARINFMKEAIPILYNYGKFKKAEEYFRKLIKEDGPQKQKTLEEFVMVQWAEDVRDASVKKASEVISGLIFRSIMYMLYNDQDAAVANERIARYIYVKYSGDMGDTERTKLPPYAEMKKGVVENCYKILPPALVTVLKARIAADQAESAEQQRREQLQPKSR